MTSLCQPCVKSSPRTGRSCRASCSKSSVTVLKKCNGVYAPDVSRRNALIGSSTLLLAFPAAAATEAERILADFNGKEINNPGPDWTLRNKDKQVFYPTSYLGTWNVTASLKEVTFPQGQKFLRVDVPGVTKSSMIAALPDVGAGMEKPVTYQCRFVPSDEGVIADRSFSQRSMLDAFLGYAATATIDYDPVKNPARMSVVYNTLRKNSQEQTKDIRKAEIFINSRRFQTIGDNFYMSEAYRQVNQAKQQGNIYDYQTILHYQTLGPGRLQADMRVAAFLMPTSPNYFDSGGKSVAHYDYTLELTAADVSSL